MLRLYRGYIIEATLGWLILSKQVHGSATFLLLCDELGYHIAIDSCLLPIDEVILKRLVTSEYLKVLVSKYFTKYLYLDPSTFQKYPK